VAVVCRLAPFCAAGLWISFFVAPTDFQQGEGYRIIFIHVPASWMSMFIYCVMAFWAAIGITFNTRLSGMMSRPWRPPARCSPSCRYGPAPCGASRCGAPGGCGTRLTSELILFFLYLGYIALTAAIDDPRRADKAGAIVALVGVVNVPIIYFSVKWWNTLHQAPRCPHQGAVHGHHHAVGHAADGAGLLDVQHRHRPVPGAGDHPRTRTPRRLGGRTAGDAAMNWGSATNSSPWGLRPLRVGQLADRRRAADRGAAGAPALAAARRSLRRELAADRDTQD
jgi:hypothetical protein